MLAVVNSAAVSTAVRGAQTCARGGTAGSRGRSAGGF